MNLDITSKLEFNANPVLIISGEQFELNADAGTMLKIMSISENPTPANMAKAGELLFGAEGTKKLLGMTFKTESGERRLTFKDYGQVVSFAIQLAAGNIDEENEKN